MMFLSYFSQLFPALGLPIVKYLYPPSFFFFRGVSTCVFLPPVGDGFAGFFPGTPRTHLKQCRRIPAFPFRFKMGSLLSQPSSYRIARPGFGLSPDGPSHAFFFPSRSLTISVGFVDAVMFGFPPFWSRHSLLVY